MVPPFLTSPMYAKGSIQLIILASIIPKTRWIPVIMIQGWNGRATWHTWERREMKPHRRLMHI